MKEPETLSVLFVCMGNICRSPTAEGVFRKLVEETASAPQFNVDSAGTHAYHVGHAPDERSQAAARRRGLDLSYMRARKVTAADFEAFDLVLAMDRGNLADLHDVCPPELRSRVRLFLEYLDDPEREEVPDPYYGGARGFEHVLDLVEEGGRALLHALQRDMRDPG